MEYVRSFWLLLLTVSMAPFLVLIYYLFIEADNKNYDLLIVNYDRGVIRNAVEQNYGDRLIRELRSAVIDTFQVPLTIVGMDSREEAENLLKTKKADALIIIPENFTEEMIRISGPGDNLSAEIEFAGDLTDMNYLFCAIWANELINEYIYNITGLSPPLRITETPLGVSGEIDAFNMSMPGIIILSIIMIMFTAMISFVSEVENKTMIRLKLSRITAFEYLAGIGLVQILIGIISVLFTLLTAMMLGFDFRGSIGLFTLIAVLTSISIIAFSLIAATATKTVNEVLIIGNFPLFLFMFFTGAMFPVGGTEMFSVAGYPVTIQGLMSPTHSVIALRKVMIMEMGIADIIPELSALLILTAIYFLAGLWLFNYRHMRIE
ncbi:ABC transporter permease [candidate division KSB1 bacterium]